MIAKTLRTTGLRQLLIYGIIAMGLAFGFLREVILANLFGTNREIEIFRVAFALPGALSEATALSITSILIPHFFASTRNRGMRDSVWAIIIVGLMLMIIGIITMPWQARILAPGFDFADHAILVKAGGLCWIMFFLLFLSLPPRAAMSVQSKIWPGASVALVRSLAFTIAVIALSRMSGQARAMDTAVATVVAAVTVLTFVLTVFGRRDLKRLSKVALAPPPWSRLTPLVSASLSVFCVQILISGGRLLDRSYTSTMDQGSLAAAEYSYAIIMATAQLIGTSSNLVLAPAIGLSLKQHNRISHAIWEHIGVIAFATTAVSLVFIFASKPIISLVYEHGAFTSSSTLLTSEFFRFLSIGLLPLILGLIFTQIVILQGDQKKLIGFAVGKLTAKAITLFGLAILFPDKIIMAIGLSFVAAETFMVFACGLYVWKVHLKSQE